MLRWLDRLPEAVRAELVAAGRERSFSAGALIYTIEDQPGGIFAIQSGEARQFIGRADGGNLLLRICRPGDSLGQTYITDGAPAPLFAEARTDLVTLFIPATAIARFRRQHVEIEQELARVAAETIRQQWRLIESLAFLSLRERLWRRLQFMRESEKMSDPVKADAEWIELDVTQAELASMLGVSRPALNRELQRMDTAGVVRLGFRKIYVPAGFPL